MKIGIPILLADLEQILFLIVAIIAGLFKLITYLSETKKNAPEPRPRPQRQQGAAQPDAAVGQPADVTVREEVEEFLRRVRQQGEGERHPTQAAEPTRRPRIEVLVDETEEVPVASLRPVAPPSQQRPLPSKRAKPATAPPRREVAATLSSQKESVPLEQRHLAAGRVTERAKHLGETIVQTDERLESHLHQKFDHQLGKLAGREGSAAEQVAVALATTPASEIADLLATPQGMQQAIILSEVFQRPTDRW